MAGPTRRGGSSCRHRPGRRHRGLRGSRVGPTNRPRRHDRGDAQPIGVGHRSTRRNGNERRHRSSIGGGVDGGHHPARAGRRPDPLVTRRGAGGVCPRFRSTSPRLRLQVYLLAPAGTRYPIAILTGTPQIVAVTSNARRALVLSQGSGQMPSVSELDVTTGKTRTLELSLAVADVAVGYGDSLGSSVLVASYLDTPHARGPSRPGCRSRRGAAQPGRLATARGLPGPPGVLLPGSLAPVERGPTARDGLVSAGALVR
jgi:hypothetical protein